MLARKGLLSVRGCAKQLKFKRNAGGHGHEPYTVPDYSIYKIDNIQKIQNVECALKRQGLSDPWARNEAWRYNTEHFGDHASRAKAFLLKGMGIGAVACAATVILETVLGIDYHGGHHGGGHDDHGHGHGHAHKKGHH